MNNQAASYGATLVTETANGWNRFWFAPVDRKPLDRLRVVTGCVALYLLATLLPDLTTYFGPNGLLPVAAVEQLEGALRSWSYLNWVNSPAELYTLHIGGMVVVALFTLGWFTPVTSVLSLVVMLSTVHRAPMITTLVEPVVTMVLFYLCLGPAGPAAGLYRWFTRQPLPERSIWAAVPLRLLQIHLVLLYAVMGLSKLMSDSWWNGTGVWWLMTRSESAMFDITGLARWTLDGKADLGLYLINFWTHAIVVFELLFAVLVWNRLLRPAVLGLAVLHWAGIAFLLGQPLLAVTMIAANLAFPTDRPANRPAGGTTRGV